MYVGILIGIYLLSIMDVCCGYNVSIAQDLFFESHTLSPRLYKSAFIKDVTSVFTETAEDIVSLHRNLISWDSFEVSVAAMPLFIGSRMLDIKIHRCFYQKKSHKNIYQLPSFFFSIANYGIGIPIVLLGSYALYGRTAESRKVGRTFLTALPFVIFGKDIIKKLRYDFCKRPWNEKFSNEKPFHGGFPSGHMAQAVYMASFFGMRYGLSHAIPLTAFAAFVGLTFINGNRHYLSQIVAGSLWGFLFAVSSEKIIQKYSNKFPNMHIDMDIDRTGGTQLSLSYRF